MIAPGGHLGVATELNAKQKRGLTIVTSYPFAVLAVGVAVNLLAFGVRPAVPALPSSEVLAALGIAAALLLVNHAWLMTTTERTRVRFRMFATPEEWAASGTRRDEAPTDGVEELERRHNAHRNTTENAVYFVFTALIFAIASPPAWAAFVWIVGFAVARLGYTFSYLTGRDGMRGLFMSLGLLSLFGMASYLAMALLV